MTLRELGENLDRAIQRLADAKQAYADVVAQIREPYDKARGEYFAIRDRLKASVGWDYAESAMWEAQTTADEAAAALKKEIDRLVR